jgi:hypothetical protein
MTFYRSLAKLHPHGFSTIIRTFPTVISIKDIEFVFELNAQHLYFCFPLNSPLLVAKRTKMVPNTCTALLPARVQSYYYFHIFD